MKESQEARVELKGISSRALDHIIDFIYTGEMTLDGDNLIDTLNAGSHLQISAVLELCSDYMITALTFANADEILAVAETYSLTRVTMFYNRKVLHNFEEFATTDQYLNLSREKVEEYLLSDELRLRSESTLYELVGKWVGHDPIQRKGVVDSLLKHVRFSLFSKQQLLSLTQHWFSLSCPDNVSKYISPGLNYHQMAEGMCPIQPNLESQARVRASRPSLVLVHQGSSYRPFELMGYNAEEEKFYQLLADNNSSRDCRMASVNNFLYMCRVVDCGGGALMNSLLRFDPRHMSVMELTPCRNLRLECALVIHNGCLYLFGGTTENIQSNWLDSIEYYDPKTNRWHDDSAMPSPTHSLCGLSIAGRIYLAGGVSMPSRLATAKLHAYNPATHTWTERTEMHCARRLHEMASVGDSRFYVLGGIGGHNVHQQTQIPIEMYDTDANQWTILSSTLAGRSVGHFVAYEGKILSIGREHQDATEDEIRQYNMTSKNWETYTKMRKQGKNMSPCSAVAVLYVNYFDEKLCKKVISDSKR